MNQGQQQRKLFLTTASRLSQHLPERTWWLRRLGTTRGVDYRQNPFAREGRWPADTHLLHLAVLGATSL